MLEAWEGAVTAASGHPELAAAVAEDLRRWTRGLEGREEVAGLTLLAMLERDLTLRERRLYDLREKARGGGGWPSAALGDIFFARDSLQAAERAYETALEQDRHLARAWLGLAQSRLELGDWPAAIEPYERYLEHRPRDPKALYNLAWILLERRNRPRDARILLERALDVLPDHVPTLIALGKIALSSPDPRGRREAQEYYERAGRLAPDDPLVQWNLGVLQADHLADPRKALVHFRRYLELGGEEKQRVRRWIREMEKAGSRR